jgi:hypothetical protein
MELHPGINKERCNQICMKHWAMMHGLIGLLDIKIDHKIESKAGVAMSQLKKDLRSFLIESNNF